MTKNKGWKRESARHSLARKGVKTKFEVKPELRFFCNGCYGTFPASQMTIVFGEYGVHFTGRAYCPKCIKNIKPTEVLGGFDDDK